MAPDPELVLVIDEGTTSTRAVVFGPSLEELHIEQEPLDVALPADGWVEQDAEQIWRATLGVCQRATLAVGGPQRIAAIGITNQRETTVVWERASGRPIAPAIVWQDRRTAARCEELRGLGLDGRVQELTGLRLDPYFSGTKAAWILDHVDGARERAEAGELLFGTIDAFLVWKLTGGAVHATDVTNASRTLLFELGSTRGPAGSGGWSAELCAALGVPPAMLPEVRPSAASYGQTLAEHLGGALPLRAVIGDQQSALVGHGCVRPGQAKITFGTGAFLVAHTGGEPRRSSQGLLGTAGYAVAAPGTGPDAPPIAHAFALEGSIFNAGTVVQWLRDGMGLIEDAPGSERLARSVPDTGGVHLVPAFTGLGAPHWSADARGTITGITRGTTAAHVVRAGLESAAFQTVDLLAALDADGASVAELRVDGGMAGNDWLMQRLADLTNRTIRRPTSTEMTARGAAVMALVGLGRGALEELVPGGESKVFTPAMDGPTRAAAMAGWRRAVRQTLAGATDAGDAPQG